MDKREILFRGKKSNGKWLIGDLVHFSFGIAIFSISGSALVISETVGRYTDMNDKNGTRIFEGDIVQAFYDSNHPDSPTIMQVIYNKKFACYNLLCKGCTQSDKFDFTDCQDIEVIGNIYDNPELLKGE